MAHRCALHLLPISTRMPREQSGGGPQPRPYLVFHYITFTLPRPTTYYYKDGRRFGVFFQAGRPPVGRWTLAGGGVGVGASTLLRPPTPSLDFVETHCSNLVSCPPHCCHYFISNSAFKVKRDYKTNGVGGIVLRKPGRRLGRLVFLGFREGVGGDGADEKWHWP